MSSEQNTIIGTSVGGGAIVLGAIGTGAYVRSKINKINKLIQDTKKSIESGEVTNLFTSFNTLEDLKKDKYIATILNYFPKLKEEITTQQTQISKLMKENIKNLEIESKTLENSIEKSLDSDERANLSHQKLSTDLSINLLKQRLEESQRSSIEYDSDSEFNLQIDTRLSSEDDIEDGIAGGTARLNTSRPGITVNTRFLGGKKFDYGSIDPLGKYSFKIKK